MKAIYLVLAVIGALVPMLFFFDFFQSGTQLDFISALFVNGAAGGFSADLLISSFVFWLYMWTQRDDGPNPAPFIAVNLLIGLSCALPAYWYFVRRSEDSVTAK